MQLFFYFYVVEVKPVTFTQWALHQPRGTDRCVYFDGRHTWYSDKCTHSHHVLCTFGKL